MRIWIVGASSGIGLELVKTWLNKGFSVVASSRSATQSIPLNELKNKYKTSLVLLDMDVTQLNSHQEIVHKAVTAFDGLSMWFYNAGAYEPLTVDKWQSSYFKQMSDVNYLGAASILTHIISYAQSTNNFRIVFNASISSYFGLPYGGAYSAPKAALVNLAQAIYPELKQHNIHVQIINHGFVATALTKKNNFTMPQLMTPAQAAVRIDKALHKSNAFEIRFPWGVVWALALLRMLPHKVAFYLTQKVL
jgi:short-subunit dehydrogenase